ncbi:WD40-repeat-containing domain protein [Cantharellus anzutake]|uniref:WD40-repeat-containing domain protein n=1 Tax=Cantharellus anzutake TaxID=1750568 RepID=UPI00190374BF|nr:WD40-repeat-containing domain protein [Cantharellus anzutake]KAF8338727.1 WD40-repeat-containing domain protein [Cantharellus anzutake]
MHVRHSIQPGSPVNVIDVRFDEGNQIFTTCTTSGFAIYKAWPMTLLRKRDLQNGTLSIVQPMQTTSLLFLVGGGRSPRYPLNKVVLWDDAVGREVGELEFREQVLGLAVRRDWLCVALKRRVVVFRFVNGVIERYREWETCINKRGLVAVATAHNSTLLTIPGKQLGHVQLVRLPPCPPPPPPPLPSVSSPAPFDTTNSRIPGSFIAAHSTPLTTLSVAASGRLLSTTSEQGTLIRIWDAFTGKLVRELRRGMDKARFYGVSFRGDETEVCVWSDKGTVHIFNIFDRDAEGNKSSNRQSSLNPLTPFIKLPKYFRSEWSYASYRLPGPTAHIALSSALGSAGDNPRSIDAGEAEKCVVGWIQVPVRVEEEFVEEEVMQYQLLALTYSGCWYRLSIPSSSVTSSLVSSAVSGTALTGQVPPLASPPPSIAGGAVPSPKDTRHPHRTPSAPRSTTSLPLPSSARPHRSSPTRGKKGEGNVDSEKRGRECVLEEFRRFGRWDGWA